MLDLDDVTVGELIRPILVIHGVFFLLHLEVVVLRNLAHLFLKRADNLLAI